MGTLKEDLERIAASVRTVTQHDVEVVVQGDTRAVYINMGYNEALVLETELTVNHGRQWNLTAYAWDRTGGVSDEKWIGEMREEYVPGVVKIWLDRYDADQDALEAILAGRPDD